MSAADCAFSVSPDPPAAGSRATGKSFSNRTVWEIADRNSLKAMKKWALHQRRCS